jgi:hypothetical protein
MADTLNPSAEPATTDARGNPTGDTPEGQPQEPETETAHKPEGETPEGSEQGAKKYFGRFNTIEEAEKSWSELNQKQADYEARLQTAELWKQAQDLKLGAFKKEAEALRAQMEAAKKGTEPSGFSEADIALLVEGKSKDFAERMDALVNSRAEAVVARQFEQVRPLLERVEAEFRQRERQVFDAMVAQKDERLTNDNPIGAAALQLAARDMQMTYGENLNNLQPEQAVDILVKFAQAHYQRFGVQTQEKKVVVPKSAPSKAPPQPKPPADPLDDYLARRTAGKTDL